MHFLVSPAKTLDFERTFVTPEPTRARFSERSAALIEVLRKKSAKQIAELMDLSPALAELNVARYAAWRPRFTAHNSRAAVVAFDGDVYEGLDAKSLTVDDLDWAQSHVSILSGLHGLLRPLDRIQPYRLEMGTPLATDEAHNLYGFWGDT
ncbi:MAG: YaaA family protein, partial [Rhizobacter sp.]